MRLLAEIILLCCAIPLALIAFLILRLQFSLLKTETILAERKTLKQEIIIIMTAFACLLFTICTSIIYIFLYGK